MLRGETDESAKRAKCVELARAAYPMAYAPKGIGSWARAMGRGSPIAWSNPTHLPRCTSAATTSYREFPRLTRQIAAGCPTRIGLIMAGARHLDCPSQAEATDAALTMILRFEVGPKYRSLWCEVVVESARGGAEIVLLIGVELVA